MAHEKDVCMRLCACAAPPLERLAHHLYAHHAVSRIALVKPQKARAIQDLILRMAQSGQVRQRISEEQLIGLLEQVEGQQGDESRGKITVSIEMCRARRLVFDRV